MEKTKLKKINFGNVNLKSNTEFVELIYMFDVKATHGKCIADYFLLTKEIEEIKENYPVVYSKLVIPRYLSLYFKSCNKLADNFCGSNNWYTQFTKITNLNDNAADRLRSFLLDRPTVAQEIMNNTDQKTFETQLNLSRRMTKHYNDNPTYNQFVEKLAKIQKDQGRGCFYCDRNPCRCK